MAHDVFISYSSQDKVIADSVCATLESRKIRCWIAPRDVAPGQSWAAALVNAISSSRVFVLVFSEGSNKSMQVIREVGEAVEMGSLSYLSALRMSNLLRRCAITSSQSTGWTPWTLLWNGTWGN